MAKSSTKGKIVTAAWNLFYEIGYDNTTVDQIVRASGTSKGSFYHYFEGKDALLGTLSYLFDEKYEELQKEIPADMNRFDALMFLNRELFGMIEDRIALDLLTRMYSSQLITKGEKHLLDHRRMYFRLLRTLISEGQERGEISAEFPANEIVKLYALSERALIYDWCICNGDYSLKAYGEKVMPLFLESIRIK